jgi:hypothetical protein
MKVADEINEGLNFNKAIAPIDKKLKEDPTPFELSTMHDTLLNMLNRYPNKEDQINRRIKKVEPLLKKAV